MLHRILQGDVLDGLRTLPDCCVQTVCTSPPYYGLRNYGCEGQIGLEETPEAFVAKMVEVFHEVKRVLRDDGTLWLNFGDSYSGSNCGSNDHRVNGASVSANGDKYQGQRPGIIPGLKAKDMIGIPWRVAFALQADGWYLRSDIIWSKPNPMPESVTDRPTKSHEYIFLLTKSARYFYDADGIREQNADPTQNNNREVLRGVYCSLYTQLNTCYTSFKVEKKENKQDQTGNPTYTGFNERYKNRKQYDSSHAGGGSNVIGHSGNLDGCDGITRNARTVWTITTQARPEAHFATFPDEIPRRCIKAGTSEYGCCPKCGAPYQRIVEASGGVIGASWHPHENDEVTGQVGFKSVGYKREFKGWKPGCKCEAGDPIPCVALDPFMGSGTVAVIARELNRSSIGCELNPEYVKIIRKRLQADSQLDSGVVKYEFKEVKKCQ